MGLYRRFVVLYKEGMINLGRLYGIARHFARSVKRYVLCKLGFYGYFVNLCDYEAEYPNHMRFCFRDYEETIHASPQRKMDYTPDILKKGPLVENFLICLKNASCFAYSDIILLDNGLYWCEIKDNPILGESAVCTDCRVLLEDNKWFYKIAPMSLFECEHLKNGIFFSGLFAFNYYHFTFQVLPKLQWIAGIDIEVPLLVDRTSIEIESFYSLLKMLTKGKRKLFVLDDNKSYLVDSLYYVSSQTYVLPGHKIRTPYPKLACFYKASTLRYLHDTLVPFADRSKNYPKKIFLGRKYVTSGRRAFNEEECVSCAKEYGFEVVYPELMTLEEQIGLFNNAEVIIGGTGAAFTNLIYCNKGVRVVVFAKFRPKSGLWQTIVEYVGGRLIYISETDEVNRIPEKNHAFYRIEIDKLKKELDEIL